MPKKFSDFNPKSSLTGFENLLVEDSLDGNYYRVLLSAIAQHLNNNEWQYKNHLDSPINVVHGSKILVDCQQGTITITLPANPGYGHEITVLPINIGTYNITINANGNTIFDAEVFQGYFNNIRYNFVWNGTTWIRYFFSYVNNFGINDTIVIRQILDGGCFSVSPFTNTFSSDQRDFSIANII